MYIIPSFNEYCYFKILIQNAIQTNKIKNNNHCHWSLYNLSDTNSTNALINALIDKKLFRIFGVVIYILHTFMRF